MTVTLTDDQRRDIAARIIHSHATDVEFLSIAEFCDDHNHNASGDDLDDINDLITSADIAVTWPDSRPDVFEVCQWLVSLDDPDPDSPGFQARRTVTLTQIIDRARQALGQLDEERWP